jgi:hypothetical protein
MYPINTPVALIVLLFLSSNAVANYICFESAEFKDQQVCYQSNQEGDAIAKDYFIEFTENLSNPGDLVSLHGEMANLYTLEHFHKSLIKYYSHATPESIAQIISQGDLSAIFLKSGEIMYFNHRISSFIFDFDSPLIFAGAYMFYGKGSKPIRKKSLANNSNCNLKKDGVIFQSPQKDSFFYSEASTYCTYAGLFFEKKDNTIVVRPISSIGSIHYSISGSTVEFSKFIRWLQKP